MAHNATVLVSEKLQLALRKHFRLNTFMKRIIIEGWFHMWAWPKEAYGSDFSRNVESEQMVGKIAFTDCQNCDDVVFRGPPRATIRWI